MKFSIVLLLFLSFQTSAQNWIDLASVTWKVSPNNASENEATSSNLSTTTTNLKIPIVLNNNNALILGLEHQHNTITQKTEATSNTTTFQSSMLQAGYLQNWNKKHKTLLMTMTRLNSTYQMMESNQFQFAVLALTTSKQTDNFEWKYGAYYNGEFFGSMIVPLVGFNWEMNDKWRLKTVLPINLEVSYQPNKNFRSGMFFEGINASYRTANSAGTSQYIEKSDNNLSVFSEIHLGKKIWIHGKVGHSILRKYRLFSDHEKVQTKVGPVNIGDDRVDTKPLFNNGMSFEIRFLYRMPT